MRALDVEISRLTDYADQADGDIAIEYYEAIQGLETTRDRAAKTLCQLGAISDEAVIWSDAMRDMEKSWRELRNSLIAAISATGSEHDEL